MASMKELREKSQSTSHLKDENMKKLEELKKQKMKEAQELMQASLDRAAQEEEAARLAKENQKTPFQESQEAWGHEHHDVIVDGINISDSLHRRRQLANRNVELCQKYLEEQEMAKALAESSQEEGITDREPIKDTTEASTPFILSQTDEDIKVDEDEAAILAEIEEELGGNEMNMNDDVVEINAVPTRKAASEISITDIATPTPKAPVAVEVEEDAVDVVEETIEEVYDNSVVIEDEEEEEEVVIDATPKHSHVPEATLTATVKDAIPEVKAAQDIDFNIDDEDIDEEEEEEEANTNLAELSDEELQAAVKKVQEEIAIKLGLRGKDKVAEDAEVSTKGVTLTNVLNILGQKSTPINKGADWVLVSGGKRITMKQWTGPELDSINRNISGRNRFNTLREIFFAIYSHITSDKPSFEDWLKTTSFFDIDHLYMAIYAANYSGKNYLPYNCEDVNCRYPFLSENHEIDDMLWFEDDEIKDRFYKIKESTEVVKPGLYPTHIEQIYDRIGVEFKEPTIYDVVFESAVLDEAFNTKYADIIRFLVYIQNIHILGEDGKWHPVICKVDADNIVKTTKTRIITYAKILAQLPSDAIMYMNKFIDQIDMAGNKVKYRLPEEVCPRCGKPVARVRSSNDGDFIEGSRMVFSRHQLTRI